MSAAAPRPVRREPASPSAQDPVSEPAWSWPIDLSRYDRTPVLSPPEAAALTALGPSVGGWSQPRRQPSLWHALDRLVSPLAAIRATWSRQDPHQRTRADLAVAALLRMCAVEQAPYWAWTDSTWLRVLGATRAAFQAVHPWWVDRSARPYLIARAYLLDGFTDLGQLGHYNRLGLAEKIFGPAPAPRPPAKVPINGTRPRSGGYPGNGGPTHGHANGSITPRQLDAIWKVGQAKGLDPNAVEHMSLRVFNRRPEALTHEEGAALIKELSRVQRKAGVFNGS